MLMSTVLNVNILRSLSNKHSYYNVNTTLQTINGINNRRRQLVLIATRYYAVVKLPNQCHALLVTRQIVCKPCYTRPFYTNLTNQDNLSASINTQKKKGYIRLTMKILKIISEVSTRCLTRRARKLTTLTKALKK